MAIKQATGTGRVSCTVDGKDVRVLVRQGRAYDTSNPAHAAAITAAPALFGGKAEESKADPVADTVTTTKAKR